MDKVRVAMPILEDIMAYNEDVEGDNDLKDFDDCPSALDELKDWMEQVDD